MEVGADWERGWVRRERHPLLVYVSEANPKFCSVCLKTSADALLRPRAGIDLFTTVGIEASSPWLCAWCASKLLTFNVLKQKAKNSQHILRLLKRFTTANIDTIENSESLISQIGQLKKERFTVRNVYSDSIYEDPGLSASVQSREESKKNEDLVHEPERVEIPERGSSFDSDSNWEEERLEGDDILDSKENILDEDTKPLMLLKRHERPVKRSKKPTEQKQARPKRAKRPEIKVELDMSTKIEDKEIPEINKAIEELDNESFIVSEEVHEHVESVALSEADHSKQRQFRMRKRSYVTAAYKCEPCVLGFENQGQYHKHMENHSPAAGSHRCLICDMYFAKHRELEAHRQSHAKSHRCKLCGHQSTDFSAAAKHYVSQHSKIKFTCMHCNMEFRRLINLKKHLQKNHGRAAEHGCAVCGEAFPGEQALQEHMLIHSPEDITWHECPVCGKKSRNKYNMNQHIKAHEKDTLPIICDLCHKTFKTKTLLFSHTARLHTPNSKKMQCDECGKFFYDKGELRIHVQWTHKRQGGVDCSQCDKKFRTAYLLNQHVRTVHENIPPLKDKLCDICGQGFASRKTLKSHRYIHTGERPYSCPDCGQAFRQRCAMRLHYKARHLNMRWKDLVKKNKKTSREEVERENNLEYVA